MRGIEQCGAPQCATKAPVGALVSPQEIPAGSKGNSSLAEVRGIEQGGNASMREPQGRCRMPGFFLIFSKISLDKATEYRYNIKREIWQWPNMVGVDDGEVPPVPIPNTEFKLTCAEDS